MEQTNWYDQIPDAEKGSGVSALADRPNRPASYGMGGLTAADLKKHFDKLSLLLFDKLNALLEAVNNGDFSKVAKIDTGIDDIQTLSALIGAMKDGTLANRLLKVGMTNPEFLETVINGIQQAHSGLSSSVGDLEKQVYDLEQAYDQQQDAIDSQEQQIFYMGQYFDRQIGERDVRHASDIIATLGDKTVGATKKEYVLSIRLQNEMGDTVGHPAEIDLPLEMAFIGAKPSEDGTAIIFELQNGKTVEIPVDSIVGKFNIVQEPGNATDAVMSQEATTKELEKKVDKPASNGVNNVFQTINKYGEQEVIAIAPVGGVKTVNGILQLDSANDGEIASKRAVNAPLKCSNIDSIVKVGVTTNTKVLTEAEKQSAQTWLGVKSELDMLKKAAQDTVYYYDYVEHVGATITPPDLAVGGAMVSAIYNKTPPVRGENLLPEAALPAFFPKRENLSLVYDAASQALVLNGTLSANESVDVPFVFPITQFAYSFKVFSLDGTVDAVGDSPTLSLRASDGSLFLPLSLETGKTTGYVTSVIDLKGKNVEAVRLSAATDTVFTNYRFQLAFQVGDTDATHAACTLNPKLRTPHTFALRSKNLWKSGTSASGTTAVTLTVDDPLPAGKYVLSFRRVAEGPPSRFLLHTLYADGSVKSTTVSAVTGERNTCVLSPTAPFIGFAVFAARTAALSEGVPIFVDEIMLEDENGQGVFYPYHEDVLLPIPQSVRSLPAYGVTLDTENYNYVDFSLGIYTENIKALSLRGEEAWEETDEAGVFALPVDTEEEPETLSTTGLFFAEMEQRTPFSIWFEDGHIKLCCPHLTSKEALCDLLATVPFCVYLILPYDEYSIPPAIVQSGDDVIFLPFEEGDTAWVLDEDGEPVTTAAITLLHQLKLFPQL
jgi:hypothetical protein